MPPIYRPLTKSTDWQGLRKPAKQENELADQGVYSGVNDRNLHAMLTMQAKIPSIVPLPEGIFAFAGFVSALALRWDASEVF